MLGKSTQILVFRELDEENYIQVNLFQEDLFKGTSKPGGFLDPLGRLRGNLGHSVQPISVECSSRPNSPALSTQLGWATQLRDFG